VIMEMLGFGVGRGDATRGGGCHRCNGNNNDANDNVNNDNNGGGGGGTGAGRKDDAAATINAGCSIPIRAREYLDVLDTEQRGS
jgi:hypothetical protein